MFDKPTPFWTQIFATTQLIPRHLHAPLIGAKSREAPANLKPVGTGPYRFVDFRPGDLLLDRTNIQAALWGRGGVATANIISSPARFRSPNTNTRFEFNLDKANAVLDAAGWKRVGGANGPREKDGRKLRFLSQTSVNGIRQKTQSILKHSCQKAGIELELKAITAAVFFSSDTGNPDIAARFSADMQMYGISGGVDPERGMAAYASWEVASKANQWQGRHISRWRSDAFDATYRAAESELDPAKRAALFIRMNDLLASDQHVLALMHRADVDGVGAKLVAPRGFGASLGLLHHWYRET